MALDMLRYWLDYIQEDQNLKDALEKVLLAYMKVPDEMDRGRQYLDIYLHRWAEDPDEDRRSKIAEDLIKTLSL